MTSHLRNSILATLVYYDILERPLTLLEVYKYMINPARIMIIADEVGEINISDIYNELEKLSNSGIIGHKNGFYCLAGRENLYEIRIERQKIADKKWKKFLRYSRWFTLNPCLEGFFACGSMALGNTTVSSDFDVFVVSCPNRIYTCRFFLWLFSSLLGVRRKNDEKIAPDKFCFNHYITRDAMFLKYQSLFTAQLYSNLKPVFVPADLIDNFYVSNAWINKYLYNFIPQKYFTRRSVNPISLLQPLVRFMAVILNSSLGDGVEALLKKYQQEKIKNNPLTGQPGGRIVFTDKELEFHPHSFEKSVIEKYNYNLKKLGIVPIVKETDSGLLP